MKNIVKMLSLVLVAGTMFVSCGDPTDDPIDPINPTTYTVTVNSNDATLGTVTISPLQATYQKGDVVTITATPNDNANFLNWNGNITENPYTYTVNENMVFTANFEAKPVASWNATFNGTPLDVAGWSDVQSNGQLWLFQCARDGEGTSVYFPYIVCWLLGTSTSNMGFYTDQPYPVELYKDTYYELGDQQFGDWEMDTEGNNSLNCTLLDLTTLTASCTMSCTMFSTTDVIDGGMEIADATRGTLALTFNNVVFQMPEGKGSMHKMNVK